MLPDRYRQLVTAFVDGELSARQRRAALRLLNRSPDARDLLRKLQGDARTLRELPRPRLGRDLSGDVVRSIRARRLGPAGPRRRGLRPTPAAPAPAGRA